DGIESLRMAEFIVHCLQHGSRILRAGAYAHRQQQRNCSPGHKAIITCRRRCIDSGSSFVNDGNGASTMANESLPDADLEVLILTTIRDPIGIGLAETLLKEAGIPYLVMDRNVAARQESGNFFGWWTIRVPRSREAEAREILRSIEEAKYC